MQSEQRKRRRGFKLWHAEEQQCGGEPAKRKRTARQLKQEQHGTNTLLRSRRGRTGGQKKDSKRTRGGWVRGGRGGGVPFLHLWTLWRTPAIHKYQTKGRIPLDNFRGNEQDQVVPKIFLIYCYVSIRLVY